MSERIRVGILDDHQSIIDGYVLRLSKAPELDVVATARFGEELEPMLADDNVDVLLLDVQVPTSPNNDNPFPILHVIPELLERHPRLVILALSQYVQRTLIKAVVEAGASGYIFKDDYASIRELGSIVRSVARGGIHFSQGAYRKLTKYDDDEATLTPRQREVLSLAAAYPELTSAELAARLQVAQSTVRNLLSNAYLRLGVRNRAAAIAKARNLSLITPRSPTIELIQPDQQDA